MSDNSNNVNFSGVRFICSPYLAIKSALASLGLIMTRSGPQMNVTPEKLTLLLYSFALFKIAVAFLIRLASLHVFKETMRFLIATDTFKHKI